MFKHLQQPQALYIVYVSVMIMLRAHICITLLLHQSPRSAHTGNLGCRVCDII